jgi:hypothetical protein
MTVVPNSSEIDDVELHDARVRSVYLIEQALVISLSHLVAYSPRSDGEHSYVWFCSGRIECRELRTISMRDWTLSKHDSVYTGELRGFSEEPLEMWRALGVWLPTKTLIVSGYGGELRAEVDRVRITLSKRVLTDEIV